jgi:hypothetical protein
MHLTEGRLSRQLEMKFGVLENAVNKLINIVSQLALDNQRLQRQIDKLGKGGALPQEQTSQDENYELDITQVQKILKQQAPAASSGFGKRIDN